MIKITHNSILLENFPNFSVCDTLECGQIFRYNKLSDNTYQVFSTDKYAQLTTNDNKITINTDDPQYFYNFFDLDTDYLSASQRIAEKNEVLRQAVQYGKGIRLLNQDLTEMIFSFIISANNNIKRIQIIINRLCDQLGKPTQYGKAFPCVEDMACQTESFYQSIGAGYRAKYLLETAKQLQNFNLTDFQNMPTEDVKKKLLTFCGIGPKVADCILLFALKRNDVFPVDTWIKKVYHQYFENGHKDSEISAYFTGLFGQDSGLCQQYLFYFQRKYRQNS